MRHLFETALLASLFALAGCSTGAMRASVEAPRVDLPELSTDAGYSYAACYFNDNGKVAWRWGLTPSNDYFSFGGEWKKTPYTKLEKFVSSTPYPAISAACAQAQSYYGQPGTLFAVFAATKNIGSNYPIVMGGNELFPLY